MGHWHDLAENPWRSFLAAVAITMSWADGAPATFRRYRQVLVKTPSTVASGCKAGYSSPYGESN
jgi:hypothetical protein